MGIGYFLHTNEYVRGRGDVPGLICRNEYKKKNFLTCLVADLIVCSAEGQMFLATYAGMSTKKNLSDTLGGGSQAVSPEKKDYRSLHTEWKRDFRPHTATVFSSSLLPRPSTSSLVRVHTDALLRAKPRCVGGGGGGGGGSGGGVGGGSVDT